MAKLENTYAFQGSFRPLHLHAEMIRGRLYITEIPSQRAAAKQSLYSCSSSGDPTIRIPFLG